MCNNGLEVHSLHTVLKVDKERESILFWGWFKHGTIEATHNYTVLLVVPMLRNYKHRVKVRVN